VHPLKVLSVFGTRPEAIKMAPLVKAMEKNSLIESRVCVTAQHREMLDSVLTLFKIEPYADLDIMQHGQTITDITVRTLSGLQNILKTDKPDYVLVHGDTTTTFVASLAAFYEKIPVGHVEAGLRTGNKYSPYPEEMNRMLTSTLADLHFAPTRQNRDFLLKENVPDSQIFITGNTVIDALLSVITGGYDFRDPLINRLTAEAESHPLIVMTCHRRENWGKPMEQIFEAVCQIAARYPHYRIVYPVHLNPAIKSLADETLGRKPNVYLIDPLDYAPFANLLASAHLILTDSGGIQEEAPALGKPILVMRTETERPEAVAAGTVLVTGVHTDDIVKAAYRLLDDAEAYDAMSRAVNPYGDGRAAQRIIASLLYAAGRSSTQPVPYLSE
jgi:UDP-N-acetylglucosamine 2-epimerase (non-hydrolysing)